ncbi:MAG: histidine kinase [Polyangiaceae bacterium]
MTLAFVVFAPWSWRALAASARERRAARSALGLVAYAASAAASGLVVGLGLSRALGLGVTFLTDEGSLVVAAVLYAIGGWGLGRDIDIELSLEVARLNAVRAHLDPHFLYNTLNAIAEWCAEDPKVAEEALLRLAAMMRSVLEALELERWPLARELSLARDLLELHRIRDEGAFSCELHVDAADDAAEIVPLSLLTLVENALKHGPRKGHRGLIEIRATRAPRELRLVVENPGPYAPAPDVATAGLPTLRKRVALAHGPRATLSVGPAASAGRTRAALSIPRVG